VLLATLGLRKLIRTCCSRVHLCHAYWFSLQHTLLLVLLHWWCVKMGLLFLITLSLLFALLVLLLLLAMASM
jgi:hypothetical protein